MPITQILLAARSIVPRVTWSSIAYSSVNEGQQNTVNLNITNWDNADIYWYLVNGSQIDGSQVTPNAGVIYTPGTGNFSQSFNFTFNNDVTTDGPLTYYIRIERADGSLLVPQQGPFTCNDTSLTPPVRLTSGTSLAFNGTDNRRVVIADNQADWNLGDNWTIEWWQKIPVGANGFLSVLCQDANVSPYSGIDVFINNGNIQMFNGGRQTSESAATRGVWNHIALQKNGTDLTGYINGVAQTFNGSHSGTIAPSSPLDLVIGSRTYDGGSNFYGQYFNGQLANIRISTVARYTGTFTVPTTVVYDEYTKLALDGSVGQPGMLSDETARHTLTNVGAVEDSVIGYKLVIADNGTPGGLGGWGSQALAVAYDAFIIDTFAVGSTITWQDNTTATITQIDNYGPIYIDIFWDTPKTGDLFPITLKTVDYPL